MDQVRRAAVRFLAFLAGVFATGTATAQSRRGVDTSAANLMAVLRESIGANMPEEGLRPTGKARIKLPDGKEVDFEMASFEYIGDMHIRFVFDGPQTMQNATPDDLARLNLKPDEALQLAVLNIKRVYGNPQVSPWTGGLMQVQGKSPDLDSSYFLDRDFWRALLKRHPEGLVVAVPKRGGLLFAPLSDLKAVDTLEKGVAYLHTSSERLRVSGALYLFKDDRWAVFQPTSVRP